MYLKIREQILHYISNHYWDLILFSSLSNKWFILVLASKKLTSRYRSNAIALSLSHSPTSSHIQSFSLLYSDQQDSLVRWGEPIDLPHHQSDIRVQIGPPPPQLFYIFFLFPSSLLLLSILSTPCPFSLSIDQPPTVCPSSPS